MLCNELKLSWKNVSDAELAKIHDQLWFNYMYFSTAEHSWHSETHARAANEQQLFEVEAEINRRGNVRS